MRLSCGQFAVDPLPESDPGQRAITKLQYLVCLGLRASCETSDLKRRFTTCGTQLVFSSAKCTPFLYCKRKWIDYTRTRIVSLALKETRTFL